MTVHRDNDYAVLSHFLQEEMRVFDSLHPAIRKVLREGDITVNVIQLFQAHPILYRTAMSNPHAFAEKLRIYLANVSKEAHGLTS